MAKITPADTHAADAVAGMTQLTDFEEIGEVLRSRKFAQGSSQLVRDTLMKDVLFLIDGEEHLARKRILARLLDDGAVASYRDRHLLPVIERCLAEEAATHRSADGIVHTDLAPLAQRCMHRVAGALSGIDGVDSEAAVQRFIGQLRTIVAGKTVDWSLDDKSAVIARANAAYEDFRTEFFEPSFSRRKQRVAEARARGEDPAAIATKAPDLLTLMALHREDTWKSDDLLIMREINTFLTASTQSAMTAFILYVMRLERWLERHPGDRALIDGDPEFLRRAAFESLRVSVSPPARIRVATEEMTLASGRHLRAGETVALFLAEGNRESARFGDDGGEFNPHRSVAQGTVPWGLSFGVGAHACPGRPLVTGSRNPAGAIGVDGTMVSMLRRFHAAGIALDPDRPPVRDAATHYEIYTSVPVLFTRL